MEIQTGTRLGPYEILAPVGAGGMGQVWRAKDTRLDREVAIKVLPPDFAANSQLQARFEREAKTISSLNHPHICTLHDVGHENGTHYLVMEMIEGESLADRLTKGRLPMDQVLRIGTQIAAALDAAHRKGIIHRDLKPGNVMLTKTGAKLLDFGLAKSGAPTSGVISGLTDMPTQARPLTQEGTILGTFQYMAPEQLEGQEADARTDIFALGALLYEMATGQRAFDGKTRTSLIAAIVSGTPRPVSELVPMTPPAFEHVVRRCLEKEADDRWQSAHDIADQLRWVSEAGSEAGLPAPVARRRITRDRILAAALVLAVAAIALLIAQRSRRQASTARNYQLTIPAMTDAYRRANLAVISPDGTRVAFFATGAKSGRQIWVRALDSFDARALEGTDGALSFCWSFDSRALAFTAKGKLRRIAADGGPVETLAGLEALPASGGMAWGASGTILIGSTEVGIHKVPATGGTLEPITKPDPAKFERGHTLPRFLADGRRFFFSSAVRDPGSYDTPKTLYLGSLDGGSPKVVGAINSSVLPDETNGYLLFVRDGTLLASAFDFDAVRFVGEPQAILDDVFFFDPIGTADISLSSNGVLTAQARNGGARLEWLDLSGRRLGGIPDVQVAPDVRFSPDGSRIFAAVLDPRITTYDLFAFDTNRGGSVRLTSGRGWESNPVPSPDGKTLFYGGDRIGTPDLVRKVLDSPVDDEILLPRLAIQYPNDVSSDGTLLLYHSTEDPEMQSDLWVLPLKGDAKPYVFVRSPFVEYGGRFSPDGRTVAYVSNESGRSEVYVRPFPGPGPARQLSRGGGLTPRWSGDGRTLYF
ncbi:MAG: protein kinase, partial [Thermoanaerobaculia bacterium]|nr:protein kinase [Thermoanaerobaculia bacterium]